MTFEKSAATAYALRAELPAAETESVPEGKATASSLGEPLDIKRAAQLIGCSAWTVRQTLMPMGLPHFRTGPSGKLIFYRNQVIRWIERRQRLQGGGP